MAVGGVEQEGMMMRSHRGWLVLPGLLVLASCGEPPPPQPTQVIVQPPPQVQVVPNMAPMPPPPPHAELVPPPPPGAGPVVWQPGHWSYTGFAGNPWAWDGGQYVPAPPGETTWVPGRWAQQPSGGWVWLGGHWA
jgi:hypothetical protein